MSANFTDENLINGWGVAFNPTGLVWVSAEGAGKSVLYDGNGQPQALVVSVPGPGGAAGSPTGIVFSGGMGFVVSDGTTTGPARFLFATGQGTIAGWAPNVNATNALTAVDNSKQEAVYTGLALSGNGSTQLLYACNFRKARIDVFDGTFESVTVPGGLPIRTCPVNTRRSAFRRSAATSMSLMRNKKKRAAMKKRRAPVWAWSMCSIHKVI